MKQNVLGLFIVFVLCVQGTLFAQRPKMGSNLPAGAIAHRDLAYVENGHERQKLDLFLPEKSDKPLPVIVWIHGGAWQKGSKEYSPLLAYVGKGYAVASINYRYSQQAVFPAQIEDCKAAIRWLRAHAKTYNLDPDRFGAAGSSAGGHLAALLGTSGDVKDLEGKAGNLEQSSRVQCVLDLYGPTDFLSMGARHDQASSPVASLLGGPVPENKEKAQKASPVTYVSKTCPPFFVIHGDKDNVVPVIQSTSFVEVLKKAGIDATLIIVKQAGHGGYVSFLAGENEKKIEDFFEKNLKNKVPEKTEAQSAPQVKAQTSGNVAVGELAPDFELPRLDLVLKDGTQSNDVVMVKLSSFRGKKPVALLFSSFT
jgi:acetyl esterase/lipase